MSRDPDSLGRTTCPPCDDSSAAAVRLAAARIAPPILVAAGLAAGALHVALADPGESLVPACPIRSLTGWWCPGCGLTRATHHLLRGHLGEAWSHHALVVPVLGALVALWWVWWRVATGHGVPRRVRSIPVGAYLAVGVAVAAFTVARNLPGFEGLRG